MKFNPIFYIVSGFCHKLYSHHCLGHSGLILQIKANREAACGTRAVLAHHGRGGEPQTSTDSLKTTYRHLILNEKKQQNLLKNCICSCQNDVLELNKLLYKTATGTNAGFCTEYLCSTSVFSNTIVRDRLEPNSSLTQGDFHIAKSG